MPRKTAATSKKTKNVVAVEKASGAKRGSSKIKSKRAPKTPLAQFSKLTTIYIGSYLTILQTTGKFNSKKLL
jgi:hypothetical protein